MFAYVIGVLFACGPRMGHPEVTYGEVTRLPIVHTSTDLDRWYVPLEGGDGATRLWFVDTGYSDSTCDDDRADDWPGGRRFGSVEIRGEAGNVPGERLSVPAMAVGTHQVALVCVVRDLNTTSSVADPPEVEVAGVLGSDVLRRFDVVIDPSTATMELWPPGDGPRVRRRDDGVVRLRWELRTLGRYTVPVEIDGRRERLLVDTGTRASFVDGHRLGLPVGQVQRGVRMRASGAQGFVERDITYFRADAVTLVDTPVGPLWLPDRPAGPFTPGLLGLDVLGQFRQEYDFRRSIARFSAVTPAEIPAWTPASAGDLVNLP